MIIKKSIRMSSKRVISIVALVSFIVATTFSFEARADSDKIMYPLKEISKLECRFEDFDTLGKKCKEKLKILHTKDYVKYIKKGGGYNDYTRLYTVLWGSSYKYGWDVGHGGHSGVDIVTSKGTPVYSIADGTVILAKKDPSWGNVVSISHTIRGKKIVSNYAHLSKIEVKKGQKVNISTKIGEVGSTGNSTGNHLHFQVDLASVFHPYYYSWKKCPYSYYKITETGVCFDQLEENTIDPLKFMESGGSILDNVVLVKQIKKSNKKNKKNKNKKNKNKNKINNQNTSSKYIKNFDTHIFDISMHTELSPSKVSVKKVQRIYKDLGYYSGKIDGKYESVEVSVIKYQLDNRVILSKNDVGAGWFGPKTRAHTKNKYTEYLGKTSAIKRGNKKIYIGKSKKIQEKRVSVSSEKGEKISRKNILSRKEIEKREAESFLKKNTIQIKEGINGGNVHIGKEISFRLNIEKKGNRKKKKIFKGSFPVNMTFEIDGKNASVFPRKIHYISKGFRDITVKGIQQGNSTLIIKMGKIIIKKIPIKVIGKDIKIYPKSVKIYSSQTMTLGEEKTGIIVFKDESGRRLVKLPFNGTFIMNTTNTMEVCIKKGHIDNIESIYKQRCKSSDYKKNPEVSYKDTVGGILLYNYRIISSGSARLNIIGKNSKKLYAFSSVVVQKPKGLTQKYEYYNEVITMLEEGMVSGTQEGYFLENKGLQKKDALIWIENTLNKIKEESINPDTRAQVNKKIVEIHKQKGKFYKEITRKQFLDLSYKYLVINEGPPQSPIEYRDLEKRDNLKINTIFDTKNTWKDTFGKKYFQPQKKVTRGEGAYLLNKAFEKTKKSYLTLK